MKHLLCPIQAKRRDERSDQVGPGKEQLPEPGLIG